jgi:hypothetical protein
VTSSTPTNLVVGAGDVYVDSSDGGASQDDNVFRIDRKYFTPELNGVKGALIGCDYIQSSEALLETTAPEIAAVLLAKTWPGSQSATVGGTTTIDEDDGRRLSTADYHDWELRVPGLTKIFEFQLDNAINLGSIEMAGKNAGNMAPKLELHGRWDPAALTVSPHRIVIAPLVSS